MKHGVRVLLLVLGFSAQAETHLLIKSKALLESAHPVAGLPGWQSLRVPDHEKTARIRDLSRNPLVEWVEVDQRYSVDPHPAGKAPRPESAASPESNDPRLPEQWSLDRIGVKRAWSLVPARAEDVLVAVIDTGVDLSHPDLARQIYKNPREIPGNGIDDDGNGFVDDVNGWNFEAKDNTVLDDYHHGTHVAGIVGAVQNNGEGIAGIAPKVKILPVRWTKNGSGWGEDAIAAIHYAVKTGARIINASWGGIGYSKALEEAVRKAEAQGVLFVASAGNGHSDNDVKPRHPANLRFSNVISVASTDPLDRLESYSNYGAHQVELGAPGKEILSSIMNRQYGMLSGTSMAAAGVSGVAALLLAINPGLRAQELKRILISTVDEAPALKGKTITGGRINALKAAEAARALLLEGSKTLSDDTDLAPPSANPSLLEEAALSGGVLRPDAVEEGPGVQGMTIQFVRRIRGMDTQVAGLAFKAQTRADGSFQSYQSDAEGRVVDSGCVKPVFSTTVILEAPKFRVTNGSAPYELALSLKCGVSQKIVFAEDTPGGQALGIWQIASRGQMRLNEAVGLGFWKRQIELIWPGKGDYYTGDVVNLTAGHHWDVVSHEFGHAIYDQAGIGVFGGGQHFIDQCYTDAMAVSEGWASFFAGWLNLGLSDPDAKFEYMVPRRAPIRFENIPQDVCGKSTNEWRVIGFFWDLVDTHYDGEDLAESFPRLWKDLAGARASSARKARDLLLQKGWDRGRMDVVWRLNFPGDSGIR